MVLHKSQFDLAKGYLLNKENPFKIDEEDAKTYQQIGFISVEEFTNFLF